jgi:hypothetical protein
VLLGPLNSIEGRFARSLEESFPFVSVTRCGIATFGREPGCSDETNTENLRFVSAEDATPFVTDC